MADDRKKDESQNGKRTVFACFAHPDDELGAIGSLSNHVERGDRVVLAWTTKGEMTSLFGDMPAEEVVRRRVKHGEDIGNIVGCEALFMDYPDAGIEVTRESGLKMAKTLATIKPGAVVTWNTLRGHPDHRYTCQLILNGITYARLPKVVAPLEAYRSNVTVYQYVDPYSPYPVVYVDISSQIDKVVAAVEYYAKVYEWPDAKDRVLATRRHAGGECGVKYAERFNVMNRNHPSSKYIV